MKIPIALAVLSLIIPRLCVTQDIHVGECRFSVEQEKSHHTVNDLKRSAFKPYAWHSYQGSPSVIGIDEHANAQSLPRWLLARKMSRVTKLGFRKFLRAAFTFNLVNPLECSNLATVNAKSKFKKSGMSAIGFESSQTLCVIQLEMLSESHVRRAF